MLVAMKIALKKQTGFTLIELLVVVSILSVLAAIAIPKFSESTDIANTGKIAADLRTLDSSIQIYYAKNGKYPDSITQVNSTDYLATAVLPPSGKAFIKGTSTLITGNYALSSDKSRAVLGSNFAEDFTTKSSTQTNPTTPQAQQ